MCTFPAIAQTGLSVMGSYFGQKSLAKSAQKQMDAAATAAITEMNYTFQNYEQERTDAFDAAVAKLEQVQHNALQLNSGVQAAVNENQSGRTANLIVRNTWGDTNRTKTSIKDNYLRQSNEIDLNKESKLKSTKAYINNLNASAPKMPSAFSNFLSTAGTALSAYTTVANQRNTLKANGFEQDFWTGGAKDIKTNTNSLLIGNDYGGLNNGVWVGTIPYSQYKKQGGK